MAILPIVRVPEAVLRQKTKKVRKIDAYIQKLIDDMIETMHDAPGVGLAANQVGVSLRVCVIHCPGEDIVTLINPEIVRRSGTRDCEEGCLSLPGYKGNIQRSEKVVVKGLNRDGRPVRYHATDLFAEAIEHEVDHLNGLLYFDYLDSIEGLVPYGRAEDGPRGADDYDDEEEASGDDNERPGEEVAAKES